MSDARSEVLAALRAMLPTGFGAAVRVMGAPLPPLFTVEADAIANAVPRRQAEFAAGRAAARDALREAGCMATAIPMGADRAPRWPEGSLGSISHSGGLAGAIATRHPDEGGIWGGVGIDIEVLGAVGGDVVSLILDETERAAMAEIEHGFTLAFCAKEAVQKAIYPRAGLIASFHDLKIEGDRTRFTGTLVRDSGAVRMGERFSGLWSNAGGYGIAVAMVAVRDFQSDKG